MSYMSDWIVALLNSVVEAISSVLSPIVMHFYISKTGSLSSSANIGPGQLWKGKQGKCRTPLRLCFAGCQAGFTGPQPPQWDGGEKGREVGRLPDDLADQVTQLQLRPPCPASPQHYWQPVRPSHPSGNIRQSSRQDPGLLRPPRAVHVCPSAVRVCPAPTGERWEKESRAEDPGRQTLEWTREVQGWMWSGPTDLPNLSQLGQHWDV